MDDQQTSGSSSSPAAGKGFCAGHDLKEIRALKELPKIEALFDQCSRMMQTIPMLPQPVIATVQGAAAAAGCQLVAQCDLAVASDAAKFVTPRRHLGLLLLDPGRRGRPQPAAQARDGDAADRRADRARTRRSNGGWSTGSCRRSSWTTRSSDSWQGRSPPSRRPQSPRASAPSTSRWTSASSRPTRSPRGVIAASFAHAGGPRRHGRLHREAPAAEALRPLRRMNDKLREALVELSPGGRRQVGLVGPP